MINTVTLINNIVTDLSAKTWTSTAGGGISRLQGVFSWGHWAFQGSPFVCVLDEPTEGQVLSNKDFEYSTSINIHICSSWAAIEAQDKDIQRREAMKNLREAWDFLKGHISKESTLEVWFDGSVAAWIPRVEIENVAPIVQLNLYQRIVRINVTESVTRLG